MLAHYAYVLSPFSHADSFQLYKPARLLSPWESLGKNTGLGCHFFLQGILPTQGLNSYLLSPALSGGFFITSATWEAWHIMRTQYFIIARKEYGYMTFYI